MKMNNKTFNLMSSAMAAALVCVATIAIKIPTPLHGYMNLGDGVILMLMLFLSPGYAFLSAGIGSALADIVSGYVFYAPATFLIKGCMALCACMIYKEFKEKKSLAVLSAGLAAEFVMVMGYLLFEGVVYGFSAAVLNVPANAVQGIAGIILGVFLSKVFKSSALLQNFVKK